MCGNGIGQSPGFLDTGNRSQDFRRNLLVQLDVLVELGDHGAAQGLDFVIRTVFGGYRQHRGDEHVVLAGNRADLCALRPFDQHLDRTIRQFEHLQDVGNTADAVKVFGAWLILDGRFLRHQHDALAGDHRRLQCLDRFGTPDKERDHHMRKHHHVTQGQQGQFQRFNGKQGSCRHQNDSQNGRSATHGGDTRNFNAQREKKE